MKSFVVWAKPSDFRGFRVDALNEVSCTDWITATMAASTSKPVEEVAIYICMETSPSSCSEAQSTWILVDWYPLIATKAE